MSLPISTTDPNAIPAPGPASAAKYNQRGIARFTQGDLPGALEDFQTATRLWPDHAEPWNNCGLVRQMLEGPAPALEDFNRALALRPDYADALNNRARARQALGDFPGAMADFDRALVHASSRSLAGIYHNRGTLRETSDDLIGALADYDRAIEADPDHVATYLNRGHARKQAKDLAGALADFDHALALLPPDQAAPAYHGRGGVRVLQNKFAAAIADYDEAIRLDPANHVAYVSKACACYHRRDPRGVAIGVTALSLNPDASAKELARIMTEGLREGAEDVLANADQHLRINPRDSLAHLRRGLTLVLLGREDEAAINLGFFLKLAPGFAPFWDRIMRHVRGGEAPEPSRPMGPETCLASSPPAADLVDLLFARDLLGVPH